MTRLALVRKRDNTVAGAPVDADRPRWIIDPDSGRRLASPAVAEWENPDYRLVEVVDLVVPDGQRRVGPLTRAFDPASGKVVESATLEDIPPEPVLTAQERIDRMLADYDLTLADLKAALTTVTR